MPRSTAESGHPTRWRFGNSRDRPRANRSKMRVSSLSNFSRSSTAFLPSLGWCNKCNSQRPKPHDHGVGYLTKAYPRRSRHNATLADFHGPARIVAATRCVHLAHGCAEKPALCCIVAMWRLVPSLGPCARGRKATTSLIARSNLTTILRTFLPPSGSSG